METINNGVCLGNSPYLTSILMPQLKLRHINLQRLQSIEEMLQEQSPFCIIEGDHLLQQPAIIQQKLRPYFLEKKFSLALHYSKDYKQKLNLLEFGVQVCIDLPCSTEVVLKTIENNIVALKPAKPSPAHLEPEAPTTFTYLHDGIGRYFLTNKTKSIYMNIIEQRLLEYLKRRKGFVSKNELSYAGWKHFEMKPNTVTVTIKKMRAKLRAIKLPYRIRSLYGYGYMLEPTETTN